MSQPPNGISIGSAVSAGLMTVTKRQTNTQTDRQHYSVCSDRPLSLATAEMQHTFNFKQVHALTEYKFYFSFEKLVIKQCL